MRTLLLSVFSVVTGVWAQQDDPVSLLLRVRDKVAASLGQMPGYMCRETIDRAEYEPKGRAGGDPCDRSFSQSSGVHLTTSDRVRLDVAVSSAVETYSWAGADRFSHRDLGEMVDGGGISTGSFADLLTVVFRTDTANFTYNGETTLNGRRLSEYGFQVPLEGSHYWYGARITGYDGTLLVDPNSAELVRLVVRTTRLPKGTKACYSTTTLDYTRVRIQGTDFLLPAASRLQLLNTDGRETDNRTVFSGCREFAHAAADSGEAPQPQVFPPGIEFRVALTQGIDTATAASGDLLKAVLVTPIMDGSKVLASPGDAVAVRIVRIRRMYGAQPLLLLDIMLETIAAAPATGRRVGLSPACLNPRFEPCSGVITRKNLGTGAGAFQFIFERARHDPYVVSSGLESRWVTASPAAFPNPLN